MIRRAMTRRAHVAGRGAVTGFGRGVGAVLDAVFAGQTALRPRERTMHLDVAARCMAEVPPDVTLAEDPSATRPIVFAVLAAREALAEARVDPGIVGLVLASTKADLSGVVTAGDGLASPARLARSVAARVGLGRVIASVSCACASGLAALSLAARRIERGEADHVLVVGADELADLTVAGFDALLALDPGRCRPFDRHRRGISLGEGAGAILLTSDPSASIGVAITGYGDANDAGHVTGPDREGEGTRLAAARALAKAGIRPRDVGVIHLHGTGTVANDASEALGIVRLFEGETAPAFGTKAQTGHTLGAAGVIETLISIEALRRGEAPANVGLEEPDVDPHLALVRHATTLASARALKVSGGFGGYQSALVVEA